MKLFFKCPVNNGIFSSNQYSLNTGHHIVEDEAGMKELQGTVILQSACPFCGQKHEFQVKDVICPLSRGENER
jgi:hypothetical protein